MVNGEGEEGEKYFGPPLGAVIVVEALHPLSDLISGPGTVYRVDSLTHGCLCPVARLWPGRKMQMVLRPRCSERPLVHSFGSVNISEQFLYARSILSVGWEWGS